MPPDFRSFSDIASLDDDGEYTKLVRVIGDLYTCLPVVLLDLVIEYFPTLVVRTTLGMFSPPSRPMVSICATPMWSWSDRRLLQFDGDNLVVTCRRIGELDQCLRINVETQQHGYFIDEQETYDETWVPTDDEEHRLAIRQRHRGL
jgi:hypothetical protein